MAVVKAPVRQQSYLTEYDRQMAEYLRRMGGSIGAQDIASEAYGGKFPVGTMTAKILSGVLAGASDRRAANRIKQSNAAQVALLRGAQEYSEPLPTEFEGAGKFTDAQGTYTQELAPVYQGIPQDENKDLLIINGDVITNLNIDSLIASHNLTKNDATISAARYSHSIPYGVLKYNAEGGFIGLEEKPNINEYVSAGIYILSSKFRSILLPNEAIDMPDLINRGKEIGLKIGVFAIHENWSDIGRPEDLI